MYLVSYDITDARRLKRVAKLLNRYGLRVQKSVFECDIDERRYQELRAELKKLLVGEDDVLCYRMMQRTRKEVL